MRTITQDTQSADVNHNLAQGGCSKDCGIALKLGLLRAEPWGATPRYITKLPKAEHDAPKWRVAMQALLLVAEHDGPTMMARIGIMRALHRHKPKPAPAPRRKEAKVYRIIRGT